MISFTTHVFCDRPNVLKLKTQGIKDVTTTDHTNNKKQIYVNKRDRQQLLESDLKYIVATPLT